MKKEMRRVKRATRKLNKAVKKATVKTIQREFAATEEAVRAGVVKPPKKFSEVVMVDTVDDGRDG